MRATSKVLRALHTIDVSTITLVHAVVAACLAGRADFVVTIRASCGTLAVIRHNNLWFVIFEFGTDSNTFLGSEAATIQVLKKLVE